MTTGPTVSLTDQSYELAKRLVEQGRFSSISDVLQHGLRLVQREEEHEARLDAIRADLARQAAQPSISTDEVDARLAARRAERDADRTADLA